MKNLNFHILAKALVILVCLGLGWLFLHTAVSKTLNFHETVISLRRQPFNDVFTMPLAYGLPVVELLIVGLLIPDKTRLVGLWASALLMAVFTGYVTLIKLNTWEHYPCSCGGIFRDMDWTHHLYFNWTVLLLNITALVLQHRIQRTKDSAGNLFSASTAK